MKHLLTLVLLAASLEAQTPLTSPYQDYRHFGELDLRGVRIFRPKVVLLTPTNGAVCLNPYEQVYSYTGGSLHICQPSSFGATEGVWATVSGGSGGSGGSASTNTLLVPTVTVSGAVATVGANCTVSTPCGVAFDTAVYRMTAAVTVTLSGTACSGPAVVEYLSTGALQLRHNALACTFTPSGSITPNSSATVPEGSLPLRDLTITSGAWAPLTEATNSATILSRSVRPVAGAGLIYNGNTLNATGGSFDVTARGNTFKRFVGNEFTSSGDYSYIGCATSNGVDAAASPDLRMPWGGETAGICAFGWSLQSPAGIAPPAFFWQGSFETWLRAFRRNTSANDIYFGTREGNAVAEFIGVRWSHSNTRYECVIRSSSTDRVVVAMAGFVDTSKHSYLTSNNGTANTITCQIDAGTPVTATGAPFPTFSNPILGSLSQGATQAGANEAYLRTSRTGL